jgi:LmbE family N-acetylglucosaminyl deacetylase
VARRPSVGRAPLLVMSPHLDDGVLSCGKVLAAHPGSVVLTVFAGGRVDWSDVTDWDRLSGFRPGVDVVAARRLEDEKALARLDAFPRWLEWPQGTYASGPLDRSAVVDDIAAAIEEVDPDMVAMPLGVHHGDHLLTHDLGREALRRAPTRTWLIYADQPYALDKPEEAASRLDHLRGEIRLTPARLPSASPLRKWRALARYRSQRRSLGRRLITRCAWGPEQYWQMG